MYLTTLADVARRTGRPVVELNGWQARGHGGLATAPYGVVVHHTAGGQHGLSMPSLDVLVHGRPGLTGPLANFGIGRDGAIYVVAAGRAYHAGAVLDGAWANEHTIGIECENDGVGEAWGEALLTSLRLLCVELAKEFALPLERIRGHKEICKPVGRKVDPDFDMTAFRMSLGYRPGGNRYAVKAGVSVATLAVLLGVSVGQLLTANPGIVSSPGDKVTTGTTVTVPAPTVAPVPAPTTSVVVPVPAPAPAPQKAVQAPTRPTVKVGSHGLYVRRVQRFLGVKADGAFGPKTKAAVVRYQRNHRLTPDGVVGPKTWKAMGL